MKKNINDIRMPLYDDIHIATGEAREAEPAQQTDSAREAEPAQQTDSAREAEPAQQTDSAQKAGKAYKRTRKKKDDPHINMAFTPENYERIKLKSRLESGSMCDTINEIIDWYFDQNPDETKEIQGLIDKYSIQAQRGRTAYNGKKTDDSSGKD